jgi:hypothetical protein
MKVRYFADAKSEFAEAIQHYLAVDSRIAEDFISEIDHGITVHLRRTRSRFGQSATLAETQTTGGHAGRRHSNTSRTSLTLLASELG